MHNYSGMFRLKRRLNIASNVLGRERVHGGTKTAESNTDIYFTR